MGNWYNNNTLNFQLNAENVSMLTIMYYLLHLALRPIINIPFPFLSQVRSTVGENTSFNTPKINKYIEIIELNDSFSPFLPIAQ